MREIAAVCEFKSSNAAIVAGLNYFFGYLDILIVKHRNHTRSGYGIENLQF